MVDILTKDKRSDNMRRIRSKDMKPELIVRRLVYGLGYRYRLHRKDLPGKPDLVFSSRKKVIFVHGCFWHQHGASNCPINRKPKSNRQYWLPKLKKNVDRDKRNKKHLRNLGWRCLDVWECELKRLNAVSLKITKFLL